MHLEQILNNSCDFKLFEFESSKFSTDHKKIEVQIRNRKNSKPICSKCGKTGSCMEKCSE